MRGVVRAIAAGMRSFNHQYLLFSGVPSEHLYQFDRLRGRKAARIFYDYETQLLIVKLIPGAIHKTSHVEFMFMVRLACGTANNELVGLGATRFKKPNAPCSKKRVTLLLDPVVPTGPHWLSKLE
jgi:hypothetical protein